MGAAPTAKQDAENGHRISETITVFGAVNMDIGGTPDAPLVRGDSNPGTVRISPGGVGRNIAHNLRLLGNEVKLVSAFGDDAYGQHLAESCRALGIDTRESLFAEGERTSTYLYITREDGNPELAVNDMRIYRKMTPEFIAEKTDLLEGSGLIIVDANLPQQTVEAVCKGSKAPVFAEPVSGVKALRFRNVLPFIHTLTPNLLEAEALTDRSIDPEDPASLSAAACVLLREGVQQVVITLGAKGCFFTDGHRARILPAFPARMVNGNGAGDALISGLAAGFCKGFSLEDSVLLGMAAASIALETPLTNSPDLSYKEAQRRMMIEKEKEIKEK